MRRTRDERFWTRPEGRSRQGEQSGVSAGDDALESPHSGGAFCRGFREGHRNPLTGCPGHFVGDVRHFVGDRPCAAINKSMAYRIIPRHFEVPY